MRLYKRRVSNKSASTLSLGLGGVVTGTPEYKVHTFLTNGTFTIDTPRTVSYLLVAGGGAGGGGMYHGGAGGGGGVLNGSVTLPAGTYSINVGTGGTCPSSNARGGNGGNSIFHTFTALGGGGGGNYNVGGGLEGGCGGGGVRNAVSGGLGTSGQGCAGGLGDTGNYSYLTGSGGGADLSPLGVGQNGSENKGVGGSGRLSGITGTELRYGGGGGSGYYISTAVSTAGGEGGGGATNIAGTNGLGGGGGGAFSHTNTNGSSGGSGVVIIRYPLDPNAPSYADPIAEAPPAAMRTYSSLSSIEHYPTISVSRSNYLDTAVSTGGWASGRASIPANITGKTYWEVKLNSSQALIGLMDSTSTYLNALSTSAMYLGGQIPYSMGVNIGGEATNSFSSVFTLVGATEGMSMGIDDVLGLMLDLDANTLGLYNNGVFVRNAIITGLSGRTLYPAYSLLSASVTFNFGEGGTWWYAPPSGY